MSLIHYLPSRYLQQVIRVAVVGAGGNGSQMVNGLAQLHLSLRALGHPYGLDVTLWDPDTVSEFNMGRSLFAPSDVGQFKSHVLINRLNAYYGLRWKSMPTQFANTYGNRCEILIGCVDTAESRRQLSYCNRVADYWLDLGNGSRVGQVILGENKHAYEMRMREQADKASPQLPNVCDLFPKLMNERLKEDDTPSCSMAGALKKQDLFINRHISSWALHLLWVFFREGKLTQHGHFVNLGTGVCSALDIGPETWLRFGYRPSVPVGPKRFISKVLKRGNMFDGALVKLRVCGHTQYTKGTKYVFCKTCAAKGIAA